MFSKITQFISPPSIAIDLGTAYTRIYTIGFDDIVEKPSSIKIINRKIDTIRASTPLRGGVIVDIVDTVNLLKPLIMKKNILFIGPTALVCAPSDISESERGLLYTTLIRSGVSRVVLIPEVWAAAVGVELDTTTQASQLLIDIGDGVTDMAIFSEGRIIFTSSIRTACSDIKKSVSNAIYKNNIELYDNEIERIVNLALNHTIRNKCNNIIFDINGIDTVTKFEKSIHANSYIITNHVVNVINKIINFIKLNLRRIPDKTYCEILESGIILTGGGACIEGIAEFIEKKINICVKSPPDPMRAVIKGAAKTLCYWNNKEYWWEHFQYINKNTWVPGGASKEWSAYFQ